MNKNSFGLYTAVSVVVANMIGTGVFTSLGFQVADISSGFAILLLWFIGGISALFGALSYAELGAAMPRSGGEYNFLSRVYHPSLGFLAGWVSFLAGFAAPVAAASIAFSRYLLEACLSPDILNTEFFGLLSITNIVAMLAIIVLTALHASYRMIGAAVQNVFTTIKILTILALITMGAIWGEPQPVNFGLDEHAISDILSPAFVISLFFVSYAYSGWNAAVYIAGEVKRPDKNIPISLVSGTIIVAIIYLLLNFIFLYIIPIHKMAGKIEVGYLYGIELFGYNGGKVMGLIIAFLLLSTISSMTIIGPRVSQVMGEDHRFFSWFSCKNKKEIPVRAIIVQGMISIIYILTATFEQIIIYIGFTLNLFALLTVIGVVVLRVKNPSMSRPYKTLAYPFVPIVFIAINMWILIYGLIYKPAESLMGLLVLLSGLVFYFLERKIKVQ